MKQEEHDMFTMNVTTHNEAFRYDGEVARILRAIAEKVEQGETGGPIMDSNGNSVGEWEFNA